MRGSPARGLIAGRSQVPHGGLGAAGGSLLGLAGSSRYRGLKGRFFEPALLLEPTLFFAAALLGHEFGHDALQRLSIVSALSELHFKVRPAAAGLPDKVLPVSPALS